MNHSFRRVLATVCASLLCGSVMPPALAADAPEVVAQRLTAPIASNKVAAVLWTRRSDRYTLQVVFPRETRMLTLVDGRRPAPDAQSPGDQTFGVPIPAVRLWLLAADGTVIPASIERALGAQQRVQTTELAYSVSLAAGERVVAAALKVDDEYFIDSIQPLSGR
jgi:hypothetical protein